MSSTNPVPPLGGPLYDKLKVVALVVLPAVSTLYFTLGNVWGWPNVEQVIGSIAAIDVFLGSLLGLSSASYNKSSEKYDGIVVAEETAEGKTIYSLMLEADPEEIKTKKDLTFQVQVPK